MPPARSIELAGRTVSYNLQITRRHTIGIVVSPESGLVVRAPRRTSIRAIEQVLREQSAWVLARLDDLAARGLPRPPLQLRSGQLLPVLGERLTLQVHETLARRGSLRQRDNELLLQVPFELVDNERQQYLKKMLVTWYMRHAGQTLPPLVGGFCEQLEQPMPMVKISRGKSRWGSCTSQRVIHLSWRLLLLPRELCDYVVAHEVCHLLHFDHSPHFWDLLERILPGAARLREKLNRQSAAYLLD